MTLLSRDSILKAQDIATKDVEVTEWGGTIRVRSMTVAEGSELAKRGSSDDKAHIATWLLSLLAVDDNGAPLFKPEDVVELEKRNRRAVESVVTAILELNGSGDKQVESAAKNS